MNAQYKYSFIVDSPYLAQKVTYSLKTSSEDTEALIEEIARQVCDDYAHRLVLARETLYESLAITVRRKRI